MTRPKMKMLRDRVKKVPAAEEMTERDPYPDLPSTGCEQCDADRRQRVNELCLRQLEAQGRIVATDAYCKCVKPQKVYVAQKIATTPKLRGDGNPTRSKEPTQCLRSRLTWTSGLSFYPTVR